MANSPIRVVVVDDHPAVREGLKELLGEAEDIRVIGEAVSGEEAIELANTLQPDVILLDVQLPDMRGDMAMRHIHEAQPGIRVLGVSSYGDPTYIQSMLDNGAAGYITKDEVPDMLLEAIRRICDEQSQTWMSPKARESVGLSNGEQTLTRKEADILEQLLADRSENEIAAALGMDAKQVGRHLKLLMQKFQTESLESLKQIARRLLPPRS